MSRAGRKAFRECAVKVVEFDVYIRPRDNPGAIVKADGTTGTLAGYKAKLHCPKTEDERAAISSDTVTTPTKLDALHKLGTLAGELMCRDCRFSAMSPVEVSHERAQLARAEAERTEAMAALEKARGELEQIMSGTPQLPEITD